MNTNIHLNINLFLLFLAVSTNAQESIYKLDFQNKIKLPPMEIIINSDKISSSYNCMGSVYTAQFSGPEDQVVEQRASAYFTNTNAMDASNFLKYYTLDELISQEGEKNGSMEISIIYYNQRHRFNVLGVIDVLTFGFGALLGIPYSTSITDLEAEAIFYDHSGQIICAHRGAGQSKRLESLYMQSNRNSHQRALKRSIEDLNNKIIVDPRLVK